MLHHLFLLLLQISELELVILSGAVIFVALIIFFGFFFNASYKRKIKQKELLIRLEYEKQQAFLENHIETQEETLKTISEEIHDNIGQVLSLAKLNLYTLKPDEHQKLEDIRQLVSKAINDLRDLTRTLHGGQVVEQGLQQSIINELNVLRSSGQFETSFELIGAPYKLDAHKETAIFRILQESLHNIIKHSKASTVRMILEYDCDDLKLSVQDNGVGFDTEHLSATKTGIGLKSMQSRAALIGGFVEFSSKPGIGTTILILVTR